MTTLTTQSSATLAPGAYGTMQWGGKADMSAAREMFDACLARGITHFDTAHLYTDGAAETMLGDIVGNRDDIYVATKVAYDSPATDTNIRTSFDISRKRLKRDCVDLLYLHRFDDTTPLEDTFATLADLQTSGAIRHIGVSNFAAWQVMKAQAIAADLGTRIDVIQPMMNLVKRQVEVEILPMARDQDIQVCAYSPLGGGLLTGKYLTPRSGGRLLKDERYAKRYGENWMHDVPKGLVDLWDHLHLTPTHLAIAWLRRHAPDVHPILSASSYGQLLPSLDGWAMPLDDEAYRLVSALSPAPAPATDRLEEA